LGLRVVYSAGSKFKYVTQALAKTNDEGDLIFTLDEMIAYVLSPDKSTLAVLRVPMTSFDEYDVSEEMYFRIRNDEFNKIIKRATRNDEIIIEYDAEQEALKITLLDKKTGAERVFYLPVIVLEKAEIKEPKMEGTVVATMVADDLKTLIQDANLVADVVELEAKEDTLVARASGQEREYEWTMKENDPLLSLDIIEESRSQYAVSQLQAATKPAGAAETAKLEFETDYPLKITFLLPNGERLVIYVTPATY